MSEISTFVNCRTGLHIFVEPCNENDAKEPAPLFDFSCTYQDGDYFIYNGVQYRIIGQKRVSKTAD